MNICFLYGNERTLPLAEWLISEGHVVATCKEKIESLTGFGIKFDFLLSFSYRYHIAQSIINEVADNAVNLHISYLPWNRGADPNIWSWLDNTPKGVSLHYISDKFDAGDIIMQKVTPMAENETLSSSYSKLMSDALQLFKDAFSLFPYWNEMRKKTCGRGSFHNASELSRYRETLDYSMPVGTLVKEYSQLIGRQV